MIFLSIFYFKHCILDCFLKNYYPLFSELWVVGFAPVYLDEDNGQTSAWYVFSSLAFFPFCPVTDQYVIGSPMVKRATVKLSNGKTFSINAENNNKENVYIRKVMLNNKEHDKNYITFGEINQGSMLNFEMDCQPNKKRAISREAMPYSLSNQK